MPVHDWTRVKAGIYHHFHYAWISSLSRALNGGLLSGDFYALAEPIASTLGRNILVLEGPPNDEPRHDESAPASGGVALALRPPNVRYHPHAEIAQYAAQAKAAYTLH